MIAPALLAIMKLFSASRFENSLQAVLLHIIFHTQIGFTLINIDLEKQMMV